MTSEVALRAARVILDDRRADGHYREPERLAFFLLGSFAPGSARLPAARAVAENLLAALGDESGDLHDPEILARRLEESMQPIAR